MICKIFLCSIGLSLLMPVVKGQPADSLAGAPSAYIAPLPTQAASVRVADSLLTKNFISFFIPAVKGNSKVMLNWGVSGYNQDFFSIERSCNGKDFEVIAVIKQNRDIVNYSWTDDDPAKGKNVYRLRTTLKSGVVVYSEPAAILIAGRTAFRFYPNPVDNILIVRAEMPIDIQILDATGKVRIMESKLQGLHTINVSSLEKGVYFFRINDRQANMLIQDKLLKN